MKAGCAFRAGASGAIAAAFYPLLTTYCKSPEGKSQADIVNQICG